MENLFTDNYFENKPLAERLRPKSLADFIGQKHIAGEGKLLWRAIKANRVPSCIFWGPPGTGKTTLANVIANECNGTFVKLNAVSSGVGDAKAVIEEAKKRFELYGTRTYLLLDECHRWNKAQSDSVLAAIEQGYIVFIGSTTENPYFAMTRAIVSRCTIFEFKPLTNEDVLFGLNKALENSETGLGGINVKVKDGALETIAEICSGDLRSALNALELAVLTTNPNKKGEIVIDKQVAEQSIQRRAMAIDENTYYEILSAFCKSLRGSDAEAALYYANRLIEAGCDPQIIARRLIAHASEDVGMADSNALLLACSALFAIQNIGLPEGKIPLTHAIIYVCEAAKSNSVIVAKEKAEEDAVKYKNAQIPPHICNSRPEVKNYKYPHNYGGYIYQQYLPNEIKDHIYYTPSQNGKEAGKSRRKILKK